MLQRILLWLCLLAVVRSEGGEVRVMTFNLWVGGNAGKQPLEQSAAVIRAAGADLVGLQEVFGTGPSGQAIDNSANLARMLGMHHFHQTSTRSILSRFPIVTNSPGRYGVQVMLEPSKPAWIFNLHLAHAPYQPYQLLGIPYADGAFLRTAAEAVAAAESARGAEVSTIVHEIARCVGSRVPTWITGDFNEPSHLDWTPAASRARLCPIPVRWPSTLAFEREGFQDSFRAIHNDPAAEKGWTWTPTTSETDPKDRHDRIDFVLFRGRGVKPLGTQVIGENRLRANIVVDPYPSDHRAVVSTFRVR